MRLSSLAKTIKAHPEAARQDLHEFTFPAPTGGWNARDPLGGMKPTDAVALDNYFPTTADVSLRGGYASYATGLGNKVETLLTYSSGATNKMFGIAGASVFDVSAAGAVGAAAHGSLTNARWQWANLTTSGGSFLHMVNSVDSLRIYDGTNWQAVTAVSVPYAVTGVTSANLANLFVFKKRLFFVEKNKLKLWYLAVDAFQGAVTAFDVSAQFKKGGYLMAGGSLTRDGGDGLDDLFVIISSNGEVVIYEGTDPGSDFLLLGRYDIGAPLGRRCLQRFGADLIALTLDGAIALNKILTLDQAKQASFALTEKIRNAFNVSAVAHKLNFGWEALSYPGGQRFIFNVPIIDNLFTYQYVQNAITGAWCRFTNMNANCWALYNDLAYFGANNGAVYLSESGFSDDGAVISGRIQTKFDYLDRTFHLKHVKMIRANFITDPALTYKARVVVDFNNDYALTASTFSSAAGRWDTAVWDVDSWYVASPLAKWATLEGQGAVIGLALATSTIGTEVRVNSIDALYTRGAAA